MLATGLRVLDRSGQPIRGIDVQLPRSSRDARCFKYGNLWLQAQQEEIDALRSKQVLEEIEQDEILKDANQYGPCGYRQSGLTSMIMLSDLRPGLSHWGITSVKELILRTRLLLLLEWRHFD